MLIREIKFPLKNSKVLQIREFIFKLTYQKCSRVSTLSGMSGNVSGFEKRAKIPEGNVKDYLDPELSGRSQEF